MRKLINLYYTIWVDTIIKFKSLPINKDDWKSSSMMLMATVMGMQFFIILLLFKTFIKPINFQFKELDIFPGERLDGMLSGILWFFMPFFILNYFLIFWKDKYKILIEKYEYKNGKYSLIYIVGTSFGFALLMLIGLIWKIVTE